MAQQLSGSPEADDQLPSRMECARQSKQNETATNGKGQHKSEFTQNGHGHDNMRTPTKTPEGAPLGRGSSSLSASGSSRSMTRTPSHEYRETLNAKSQDMDDGSRIINQYKMLDVIGQGAYGTVHKATFTDDPGQQFAIKEFGKTRLRKNDRYSKLRRNRERNASGGGGKDQAPHAVRGNDQDPLSLIRHEIAILKKLHHPHVVKLFEVLDDPSKDSLYLVFDYCPDGTVIDIKLNEPVEPLPLDIARSYFVQILMGIEYLHENEVVHRDIKPDNILLAEDRKLCRIVDFGVSEMFTKPGDDTMEKSAGSPAFMSPELCTAGHREYHGKSDDIWSLGVTLYCMVVGHLPFGKDNFYALYEAIKNDEPTYPDHLSANVKDLLQKMLTKNPAERITIPLIRQHPWVQEAEEGTLLPKEENLQSLVSDVTKEELDCAICKITNIFTFARAVSRFKKGGSMARARREASRTQSGGSQGSDRDKSWFPPTSSPSNHAFTSEPDDTRAEPERKATEMLPPKSNESSRDKQEAPSAVESAKNMLRSSLHHITTTASSQLQTSATERRTKTAPIDSADKSARHDSNADKNVESPTNVLSPVWETEDEPPKSSGGHQINIDQAKTLSSTFSAMLSLHRDTHQIQGSQKESQNLSIDADKDGDDTAPNSSESKPSSAPNFTRSVQRDTRSAESHLSEPKDDNASGGRPKLLPDAPIVMSPFSESLQTPPGASNSYVQGIHRHHDHDSYFANGADTQSDISE